jgi:hypothetical protein
MPIELPKSLLSMGLLFILSACTAPWASPSAPAVAPSPVVSGIETVQRILHPAGPTVRTEWRADERSAVSRIHIVNARSGQVLLGQTRLQRLNDGGWQISVGNAAPLRLNTPTGTNPQRFVDGGQNWEISVEQQHVPRVQPGVSTETEPALDLRLWLR